MSDPARLITRCLKHPLNRAIWYALFYHKMKGW
nr:MAG TPA: hypothetical protein [Caudoviricetes sp.]